METKKASRILAVALSFATLAVYGCGGGGGGGGGGGEEKTPAPLTSSNAPSAASGAIQAVSLTGLGEGLSSIALLSKRLAGTAPAVDSGKKPPLMRIIDIALSSAQANKAKKYAAPGSMPQETINCPGPDGIDGNTDDSGTMTMSASWSDMNETTYDIKDFNASISSSSCVMGTETLNGTMTFSVGGWLSAPTSMTLSATMTYSDTYNGDNITMTNFSMTLSDLTVDSVTGEFTTATFTLDGTVSGTSEGDPINLEFDNYSMALTESAEGTSITISGSLKEPCVGGWVTVYTDTSIFVPAAGDCPTAGVVRVVSGTNTVKVEFTSDTHVHVYFNDTHIQEYSSCEDVDGLCS